MSVVSIDVITRENTTPRNKNGPLQLKFQLYNSMQIAIINNTMTPTRNFERLPPPEYHSLTNKINKLSIDPINYGEYLSLKTNTQSVKT